MTQHNSAEGSVSNAASSELVSVIVNQKLAFTRILLKAARQAAADDTEGLLRQHAFLDSALNQLHSALRFFVEEVSGVSTRSKITSSLGVDLGTALRDAVERHPHSPELKELSMLANDKQVWLHRLLALQANPFQLAQQFNRQQSTADATRAQSTSVIAAVSLSVNPLDDLQPIELIEHLSQKTQQLVDRHRYSIVED